MIEAIPPDVIVLDVMLPDVDGWNLLLDLHEHPATRSIPVIVCSVVREENLAMSLGAALYLSKPVSPRQFIRALDQVLGQSQENMAPANRTTL
jgi:CheY-like chemotaxis protein